MAKKKTKKAAKPAAKKPTAAKPKESPVPRARVVAPAKPVKQTRLAQQAIDLISGGPVKKA